MRKAFCNWLERAVIRVGSFAANVIMILLLLAAGAIIFHVPEMDIGPWWAIVIASLAIGMGALGFQLNTIIADLAPTEKAEGIDWGHKWKKHLLKTK